MLDKARAEEGGKMRGSVQPGELQQRRRRQLAIVVMGVVVAICILPVVYELG